VNQNYEMGPLDVLRLRGVGVAFDLAAAAPQRSRKFDTEAWRKRFETQIGQRPAEDELTLLVAKNADLWVANDRLRGENLRLWEANREITVEHSWLVFWRRAVIALMALYIALDVAGYFLLGRYL
jgi:hypothetical protein